jgi:hypothetical protein
MSSMALCRDLDLRRRPLPVSRLGRSGAAPVRGHRGIFKRISAAIERWQRRDTEKEAGRFIAEHGGRLTDDIERQLNDHFIGRGLPPFAPPR